MPVGVDIAETAMFFELEKADLKVVDGRQACWTLAKSRTLTKLCY